jgi:uncharacterized protein (DUF2267 family)
MSPEGERFVRTVAAAAGTSVEEAERATHATLETLADRIDRGEARDVAAQLPPEIGPALFTDGPAQAFGLDAFIRRVAERAGTDPGTAQVQAAAVFTALRRALSADELHDVAAELPREFQPLIGTPAG